MALRKYTITCRSCDGKGFYPMWTDDDGQGHLDKCSCYRGLITIILNPDDERKLLEELKASVGE
jgi:hypothetical protein